MAPSFGAMEIAGHAPEEARAEESEAEPFTGEAESSEIISLDAVSFIPQNAVADLLRVQHGLNNGSINLWGALVRVANKWLIVTCRTGDNTNYIYLLTKPGDTRGKTIPAKRLAGDLTAVVVNIETKPRARDNLRIYAQPTGLEGNTITFKVCANGVAGRASHLTIDTFLEMYPRLYHPLQTPVITTMAGAPLVTLDGANFPFALAFSRRAQLVVGGDQGGTLINSAAFAEAAVASNTVAQPGSEEGLLEAFERTMQPCGSPTLSTFDSVAPIETTNEDFGKLLAGIYGLPQPDDTSDSSLARTGAGEPEETQRHAGRQEDARGGQPRPPRGTTFVGRGGSPPPHGRSLFDLGSPPRRGGEEPAPQRQRTQPQHRLAPSEWQPMPGDDTYKLQHGTARYVPAVWRDAVGDGEGFLQQRARLRLLRSRHRQLARQRRAALQDIWFRDGAPRRGRPRRTRVAAARFT